MDPEAGDNSDQGRLDGRNLINVSLGGSRAGMGAGDPGPPGTSQVASGFTLEILVRIPHL